MNFITRCLKSKVVPKGFISKQRISSTKSKAMEQRFGRIRMVEQRRHLYGKLEKLEKTRTNILNLEATHILHDQFSLNFNNQPADDLNDITSYSVPTKLILTNFTFRTRNSKPYCLRRRQLLSNTS